MPAVTVFSIKKDTPMASTAIIVNANVTYLREFNNALEEK